jgi:hypothetical protein
VKPVWLKPPSVSYLDIVCFTVIVRMRVVLKNVISTPY